SKASRAADARKPKAVVLMGADFWLRSISSGNRFSCGFRLQERRLSGTQDWSTGLMRRLRPSLVTSTWRTLGGKATGFGNRTAWLRLVVKTVERATRTSVLVYPKGIYEACVRAAVS